MQGVATRIIVLIVLVTVAAGCQRQAAEPQRVASDQLDEAMVVEAACGQCQFGLAGESCDLAVRIEEDAYFVDGTGIDDHGDAHAADGLCNAVRRARVEGRVENDRFLATSFELLPAENQ